MEVESMGGAVEDEGSVAAALREALRQQARTVEELRAELEEERRAASSGADEALAMILRLQAERAAERMEAEQFRRVAEERIRHDEDTLAFLKAVVFHQEMEISSLNRRLLAVVHADAFSPVDDLPWLRKLARSGGGARAGRNASLPSASLEELCSAELDDAGRRRPARTVSDIGEVIGSDTDWTRLPSQPPPPTPRLLHRSASHYLRRSPSHPAQTRSPASRASPPPPPEMIAEQCETNSAALEADVEQIKAAVQSLHTELTHLRESTASVGDAQSRLLAEIRSKLDGGAAQPRQTTVQGGHGSSSPAGAQGKKAIISIREEEGGSSSNKGDELLMNHFIQVRGLTSVPAALLVRPLLRVATPASLLRCFLVLALAVAIRKLLINS